MKRSILPILLFCLLTFCLPMVSLLLPAAAAPSPSAASSAPPIPQQELPSSASAIDVPQPSPSPEPAVIRVQNAPTGEVLEVPVLDYIIGAVASEMPITWPDEALKAQAVAAQLCFVSAGSR